MIDKKTGKVIREYVPEAIQAILSAGGAVSDVRM
jgi:hypothetical protein